MTVMHPRPASLNPLPHVPSSRDRSGRGCLPDEEPTQQLAYETLAECAAAWKAELQRQGVVA